MSDRTTGELINGLGEDIDRCHENLIDSVDTEFIGKNGWLY